MADGTYRMAGSAFMLSAGREEAFLVTARHVIDGIRSLGLDRVWLRVNLKDDSSRWIKTDATEWIKHPSDSTVDVALLSLAFQQDWDHMMLAGWGITEDKLKSRGVAAGDAVFITGLFRHHQGARRNIPIARHGNLACLNEELISTRFGQMDAFLIEVRSIGGLSGSPVFLNLGPAKSDAGEDYNEIYLFGLIHGHFDMKSGTVDSIIEDFGPNAGQIHVNTGIAIVVPYPKIAEVLAHAKIVGDSRKKSL